MNKIYKVIWSKTKHCYIVASELAKSHTKGSGARSLRRAAVCLGIAAALIGGVGFGSSVAWAADISGGSSITISDTSQGNEKFYLNGSNIAFTVGAGGAVYNIIGNNTGAVSGNAIVINGGTITNADVEYDTSWNAVPSGINGGYNTTGAVSDNHVTITNATIGGYYPSVYGGHSDSGSVSKNTVTIDSNNSSLYVYGGYSGTGTVGGDNEEDGNIVTLKSGAVNYIAGGASGNNSGGLVKNNQVTVENGTVGGQVIGGYSLDANTELNKVVIDKGSIYETLGGQSDGQDVLNNIVTINDGTITNVYGGKAVSSWITSDCGDAKGNQVTIGGGAVSGSVYGGYSEKGTAGGTTAEEGNKVTITSGTVGTSEDNNVYGGWSNRGEASFNQVSISKEAEAATTLSGSVYGGRVINGNGAAKGNKVTVSGGTVGRNVYGGSGSGSGTVSGNTVEIENGTVSGSVYGGNGYSGVVGGDDADAGNKVAISGSATEIGGALYGGYANSDGGQAKFNTVTFSGKSVGGSVWGGYGSGTSSAIGNSVEITSGTVGGTVYGGYSYHGSAGGTTAEEGNKVTITGGTVGYVHGGHSTPGTASNNSVIINGGTVSNGGITIGLVSGEYVVTGGGVMGGYSESGNVSGNTVDLTDAAINGTTSNPGIAGGYSRTGDVTGNTVTINGLTTNRVIEEVYGGYTQKGNVGGAEEAGNTVMIKSGTIGGAVYGGYAYGGSGDVSYNTVEMQGGSVGKVFGGNAGNTGGSASYNTVTVTGGSLGGGIHGGYSLTGDASNNMVTIRDNVTEVGSNIYGAEVWDEGSANDNKVTVSAGAINGDVYGAYGSSDSKANEVTIQGGTTSVDGKVVGGRNYSGEVSLNKVTITGGTVSESVIGGSSTIGSALNNQVIISGGEVGGSDYSVIGGQTSGDTSADVVSNNSVTIKGNNTVINSKVLGGILWEAAGAVIDKNTVTIEGGTVNGDVTGAQGGSSGFSGITAKENKVNISGGSVNGNINGAIAYEALCDSNTVSITGGTVTGSVYGGHGDVAASSTSSGDVTNNSVTIEGADTKVTGAIYGGRSEGTGNVTGNKVIIKSGTVEARNSFEGIYGGSSKNGDATDNTVIITGGTIKAEVTGGHGINATGNRVEISGAIIENIVYGGKYFTGTTGATNNTVVLGDVTVTGNVCGGYTFGGNNVVLGNTLILSDVNNAVRRTVNNFETIKLGDTLAWSDGATALQAKKFADNTDGTRASLDITDAETNLATAASGQMTLLASETDNDFNTLSLVYSGSDSPVALSETNQSKILKSDAGTPESSPTNGVTLTYASSHMVSLDADNSYKNVLYKVESIPSKISLGDMTWGTGRDLAGAFNFSSDVMIDAANLTFADTTTLLKKNDKMTLVSNATGITSAITPTGGTGKTIGVNYNDSGTGIAYEATAEGNVTAVKDAVQYTVSSVTADKITLASQAWGTTAELPDASWKASSSTQIDDTSFAYTGEAVVTSPWKIGNAVATIVNAPGLKPTSPVQDGAFEGKAVGVSYTDENGIGFAATANGHVTSATDAVKYVVDSVAVNGVNLAGWDGANTSAVTTGWTGTGVDVTGSFAVPTDLKEGAAREIVTATAAGFFDDAKIAEAIKYGNGDAFTENENGIALAGHKVGGVKAEDSGKKLTYYAMKKTADTVTLGTVAFANNGTARKYDSAYDLTAAAINADGLKFSNTDAMETGNTMTIVDASGAKKDGSGHALAAFSDKTYKVDFTDTVADKGLTVKGTHTDTLGQDTAQTRLTYTVGAKNVDTAAMTGEVKWKSGGTHYTNDKYTFTDSSKTDISGVQFTSGADPLNQSMTLIKNNVAGTVTEGSPKFTVALGNTNLEATARGNATIEAGDLKYMVTDVELNNVTVNDVGSDAVPDGWTVAADVTVDTGKMTVPEDVAAGEEKTILTASGENTFSDDAISGKNKYGKNPDRFTDRDDTKGVTLKGTQDKGVKASADGKSLVYAKSLKNTASLALGNIAWQKNAMLLDGSKGYDYSKVSSLDTGSFTVTYANPENVAANDSMTLLKANETLQDMAGEVKKTKDYGYEVAGVTMNATITGSLAAKDKAVTFTAESNQARELSFGKVEWTGDTPLIDHSKTLANVSFDGATVDTSNIDFYKEMYIEAEQKTTLVSHFGGKPKEIKGDTYMVGTAFEGEGSAAMEKGNLIFRTKTAAGVSEQTHKAVMAAAANVSMLKTGNDHVGKVLDGLGDLSNRGEDGTSTSASIGGGSFRDETGSHVNTHTWNAAVAVGAKREVKGGSLEYGIFGEYGKASYTMHSEVGQSDGDAHYAGAGLMAKWTNKHDVYTEASFRMGRMSDNTKDLLRDGAGNAYGYDVHANYYGAHVGVGKVFRYDGGKSLDVYGRFFYTKRDGVEFDAKQHYDLDSVSSSLLRIGARYGTTDKKWNWYGGLAYEYEFDGEAKGNVNGTAIRAASIKGSSVRAEIGMRMNASKTNPWQTDISLYGYGGKHRGLGGNVSVAYTF